MQRVPFNPEEPPRNFPLLSFTCRSLIPEPFSDTMFQSSGPSRLLAQLRSENVSEHDRQSILGRLDTYAPAMWVFSKFSLSFPASSTSTRTLGSSASLPATTQPAVPPLVACQCLASIEPSAYDDSPAHNEVKTSIVIQKRTHFVPSASGEGSLNLRHLH